MKAKGIAVIIGVIMIATAFVVLATPVYANSSSDIPSGIAEYVPITLINYQSTDTPTNFQQQLTVDWTTYASYVASDLSNVEFFDSTGTPLYAWLESGTSTSTSTVWINLGSDTIGANGGALTIYMGFFSTSTNNFGSNSYWGEAPQLSSTYAEYDNGALVFTNYWNFAGTSLPSDWTSEIGTITVSDGVTVTPGSLMTETSTAYPISNVLEADVSSISYGTSGDHAGLGIGVDLSGNAYTTPTNPYWIYFSATTGQFSKGLMCQFSTTLDFEWWAGDSYPTGTVSSFTSTSTGVWGMTAQGTSAYYYLNYAPSATITSSVPPAGNYYPTTGSSIHASSITYEWIRVRDFAPEGTMPTAEFGTPTSLHQPPMNLSFQASSGNSAGWVYGPGNPNAMIYLTIGPDSGLGGYAVINVHHFSTTLSGIAPYFTATFYSTGTPRLVVWIDSGNYIFIYPVGTGDVADGYVNGVYHYDMSYTAWYAAEEALFGSSVPAVSSVFIVADTSYGLTSNSFTPYTTDITSFVYNGVELM